MDNKPENDNPKISPRKDGPLRVEGPANFFDTRGTQIDPLRKKKGNIAHSTRHRSLNTVSAQPNCPSV